MKYTISDKVFALNIVSKFTTSC